MCTFASMKRLIPIIIVILFLLPLASKAESMDRVFAKLPIPEFSMLSLNDRLDLLDYANCGQKAVVENLYGGKTTLALKRDNYLRLELTSVNSLEVILLQREKGDTIVAVLSTIHTPMDESQLKFYTLAGESLPSCFKLPQADALIDSVSVKSVETSWQKLLTVKAQCEPEDTTIVCETSLKLLPREEQKKYAPMYGSRRYKWNGTTFVLLHE